MSNQTALNMMFALALFVAGITVNYLNSENKALEDRVVVLEQKTANNEFRSLENSDEDEDVLILIRDIAKMIIEATTEQSKEVE